MKQMPTIHRMGRRSSHKNYELPGIYHITIKAAETLHAPFGKMVGDLNKPDGDPDAPRVALSPVGQMVKQELLHSISTYYPMVEVQDHVIMPEHMHFIVQVKKRITNSEGHSAHLGHVIAGYKKGCNRRYWELTNQQGEPAGTMKGEPAKAGAGQESRLGEPAKAGAGQESKLGEPAKAGEEASAGRLARQGKRPPSNGTSGRQPLFQEGYVDVMPIDAAQLEQQRAYIKGNPRSRLMRMSNRAWLQPQRTPIATALTLSALQGYLKRECAPSQLTDLSVIKSRLLLTEGKNSCGETAAHLNGGTAAHVNGETAAHLNGETAAHLNGETAAPSAPVITCHSYGNRQLLEHRLLPVVCHRKDARRLEEQKQRCLDAAEQGAVLVSPRIAKGEQAIIDAATNHGSPVILIADNGFPEVYHPSAERIERCATGQLLIVTPWEYHYRRSDEGITVVECKTMNCITQALCRTRDDWWKREGS